MGRPLLPKTWRYCQNKEILVTFKEVISKAKELGIIDSFCNPTLYTFKSTSKWGEARKDNRDPLYYARKNPVVGINECFLSYPDKVLKTLVHEVAHLGRGSMHNSVWYRDYEKLGKSFGISEFTRCDSCESLGVPKEAMQREIVYKYAIMCPKCGARWKYKRMCDAVRLPKLYRCTKCKSELVRDLNFKEIKIKL